MELSEKQRICLEVAYGDRYPEIVQGFADDTPQRQQYFLEIAERIAPQVLAAMVKLSGVHKMLNRFKSDDENLKGLAREIAENYKYGLPNIARTVLRDMCGDFLRIEDSLKNNEISLDDATREMESVKNSVIAAFKHAIGEVAKNTEIIIPPNCDEMVDWSRIASVQWQIVMEQEVEKIFEKTIKHWKE